MARLSIYLLGPFQVILDGEPVTAFVSDKARALLAYLAVEADHPHRRETLTGLLWPDVPELAARRSLTNALSKMRKLIGDGEANPAFVDVTPQTIQFDRTSDSWIDVAEFITCLEASKQSRQADPCAIYQLEEAVKSYQGEFLKGFSVADSQPFEEWALFERESLDRQAFEALERLIAWYEGRGQAERALPYARRQVDLDPLRESAHRHVMRLLWRLGERAKALEQYKACCRILQEELEVEPDQQTTALYEQIKAGVEPPSTPSRPLFRVVNASVRPHALGSFHDRGAETAWLRARLAEPAARLINIIGRGGYGKTALVSNAVIEAETGALRIDGRSLPVHSVAYFEPDATGATLGRLYGDLGAVLGEPFASRLAHQWQDETASIEQKAHFLLEQLMRAIQDGEVILIVLDGLEKALDDTGQLADEGLRLWLEACLRAGGPVRLIATSRQRWQLPDDVAHYARWLDLGHGLPEGDAITLLRTLDSDGACGLRDADEALLRRTAQQTDGVPFSLYRITGLLRRRGQILTRLLDDSRLFEQEVTLALAEEMYKHVSSTERRVIDALAIYGRPVPDTAVASALVGEADLATVGNALWELASAYLVTRSAADTWSLHGVDAEVACLRLSPEEQVTLHQRAGEFYEGSPDERDILRAAHHLLQARDFAQAARLATLDVQGCINQFQASELRRVLEEFRPELLEVEHWVGIMLARGDVYTFLGDRDQAQGSYKEALTQLAALPHSPAVRERTARACRGLARLLENDAPDEALEWLQRGLEALAESSKLEEAELLLRQGSVLVAKDEYAAAVVALEGSLRLLPEGSDDLRARVLGNLGVAWCSQGDLQRGEDHFERALAIFHQLQDHWGEAGALHNLGMISEYTGDWIGAANRYQGALELAERLGDIERQVELESSLGILQTKRGDYDSALGHLIQFIKLAGSYLKEQRIYGYSSLADLRIRRGELGEAEASLDEAERLALDMPARSRLPEIYRLRAELRLAQGESQPALELAAQSVSLARELENLDPLEEGTSLRALGEALFARGQVGAAVEAFEQSSSLLQDRDDYEAARTKAQWGRVVLLGGALDQGTHLLQEARAKFKELGAERNTVEVDRLLASG